MSDLVHNNDTHYKDLKKSDAGMRKSVIIGDY